jgi:hypothetical protein
MRDFNGAIALDLFETLIRVLPIMMRSRGCSALSPYARAGVRQAEAWRPLVLTVAERQGDALLDRVRGTSEPVAMGSDPDFEEISPGDVLLCGLDPEADYHQTSSRTESGFELPT